MILRSLTKHVKDQNWFAVGLDFAIVIVGVFIGMQVSNWNDMAAEKQHTQRLLSELATDLQDMKGLLESSRDRAYQRTVQIDSFLSSMEDGKPPSRHDAAQQLARAFDSVPLPSAPLGLRDLLVSSRLDLIERESLRNSLRRLAYSSDVAEESNDTLLRTWGSSLEAMAPYLNPTRSPAIPAAQLSFHDIDVEGLWESTLARGALTSMYSLQLNIQSLNEIYIARVDSVLNEIAVPE
ncbi:hypothetical protein R0137_12185 [Congregibacter brevis]|uniref:Uncharacterized protein n=1 Tax=Congregibacter brevis TaxID=3081201 RepID=A0ABZ0I9H3_9GAMM|nr:hypothetical protein R0137_12185 [Congregibacter sp. IMCC45268]